MFLKIKIFFGKVLIHKQNNVIFGFKCIVSYLLGFYLLVAVNYILSHFGVTLSSFNIEAVDIVSFYILKLPFNFAF